MDQRYEKLVDKLAEKMDDDLVQDLPGLSLLFMKTARVESSRIVTVQRYGTSTGWLARIEPPGPNERFDLKRTFLSEEDSTKVNDKAVAKFYPLSSLRNGIYEAESAVRGNPDDFSPWRKIRHYFEIKNKKIVWESSRKLVALRQLSERPIDMLRNEQRRLKRRLVEVEAELDELKKENPEIVIDIPQEEEDPESTIDLGRFETL